jgi:heptosyltransferase-3
MMPQHARSFVIVRQDNLGDVALALPMAGWLAQAVPGCTVRFAVRHYARDVARASRYVDEVLVIAGPADLERELRRVRPDAVILAMPSRALAQAAWRAKVPVRVGTARRWFHWLWATHRPWLRRRGSDMHEAALNLQLLAPFAGAQPVPRVASWAWAGLPTRVSEPECSAASWPRRPGVANILVQLRSNGHGKEWPLASAVALIQSLASVGVNVIVNGTPAEGAALRALVPELFGYPHVTDATHGFSVADLMRVLPTLDAVLASSTGPLHLAALSGVPTLGLFVDLPGMDPRRWGPLGPHVHSIVAPRSACVPCPRGAAHCPCMAAISVEEVRRALLYLLEQGRKTPHLEQIA